ncbi:MAG: YebC/PmpR family DNA-binding transcriptional regulator [Verrucomicrobiae bacterium]|nr:YebC/PmpR family DNA-binding transcriptional regulator [Verrucomicrobiae bacterium]
MGAQWKQAGREAAAHKKGQVVGKMVREIMIAAKIGGADPDLNARLHVAVDKARKASVTRDTIERAIKKGAGLLDEKVEYETVLYEGFAPHKVPVIVECLTDNRNRTAPDIRHLFSKGGQLGQPGSMGFFFDHLGVVEATHADLGRDPEADAIEAGAENLESLETAEIPEGVRGTRFFTNLRQLTQVSKWLKENGWTILASEMRFVARNPVDLPPKEREAVVEFLHALDDHDDVHQVFAGLK